MPDQISPNFYSSNEGTQYPFVVADVFSRGFVDAQVSVPAGYPTQDVVVSQWDPAGQFEVKAGADVIIPLGTPVSAVVFGDYMIWEARTADASATFVFALALPPPAMTGTYVLQERAVTRGRARELYVVVGAAEAAGPGETLRLLSGSNVNLATQESPGGAEITIDAFFDPSRGCSDTDIVSAAGITTINGLSPDANGNVTLLGTSTYLVEKAGPARLRVVNIGEPCCDCPDYIGLYNSMSDVSDRLNFIAVEMAKAQDAYRQLLAYVRFALQAPIVGGVGGSDTDRIASD